MIRRTCVIQGSNFQYLVCSLSESISLKSLKMKVFPLVRKTCSHQKTTAIELIWCKKKFTEYRRHLGSHLKIMFWSKYFEPRHPLTVAWNIETRASISCNPLRPVLLLPFSRSSNPPIPCWPVFLLPFSRSSNLPIPAVLLLFFPSSNPSL